MNIFTTSIEFEFLKMRTYHIFFMIVIEICDSEIDRDQNDYLISTSKVECGKSPGRRRISTSRMIYVIFCNIKQTNNTIISVKLLKRIH